MASLSGTPRRFPLRAKLLLAALAFACVPYFGYGFLRDAERHLREAHADGLMDAAATLATLIAARPGLLPAGAAAAQGVLFVHPLRHPIEVDGYADDWREYLEWADGYGPQGRIEPGIATQAAVFRLLLGEHGGYLYALLAVDDEQVVYAPVHRLPADGRLRRFLFATAAPGRLVAYERVPGPAFEAAYRAVTNIVGAWQPAPGGYRLELRLPVHTLGPALGFLVTDVDTAGGPIAGTAGTAGAPTLRRPGPLQRTSRQLAALAEVVLHGEGRRAWVLDAAGHVLAVNGDLRRRIERRALDAIYALVLPPVAGRFADDLTGASRLHGAEVRAALAGVADTRRRSSPDGRAVIVSAAHPIRAAGEVRGAVVVEETTAGIQMIQRRALAGLVNGTLAAFGTVSLLLLAFATRLSVRLRRLARDAERAIDAHGRVIAARIGDGGGDEIGDLGRSFSMLLARLRHYHEYLEGMARRLAHELRTPLAVVRSSLENLDAAAGAAERTAYLARARDGVARLELVLTRLSEARRLEQALAASEREPLDLAALVRGCVEGYRDAYPQARFVLGGVVAQGGVRVCGAPELLAQSLDKLVANAVDFSAAGRPIEVSVYTSGARAVLEVVNRGPLLPQGLESELFNSMVSTRGDGDAGEPHLGLGLYIVRLIAEFHGGAAGARNLDDGVCFSVELPLVRDAQ